MEPGRAFQMDEYESGQIMGMTAEYPYCMHRRDLTEFSIPWHWHEELELGYVESGVSVIRTLNGEYPIHAGEGFFINTNVMDCKRGEAPGVQTVEINHLFHPVFLSGHFQSLIGRKYLAPVLKDRQLEVWVIRPDHEAGRQLLLRLRQLTQLQTQPDAELLTRNLLSEAWLLLLRELRECRREEPAASADGQERIRAMLAYIHQHYAEKITAAEIAQSAHISEREALRCFRRCLHTTLSDYLMEHRLHCARRMLRESGMPVAEVALRTGFSDAAYFGKVFRSACGMTPTQYRRHGDETG